MTAVEERVERRPSGATPGTSGPGDGASGGAGGDEVVEKPRLLDVLDAPGAGRIVIACTLTAAAAAVMAGGIFGSWMARAVGVVGVLAGAGYAWATLRSRSHARLVAGVVPSAFGLAVIAIAVGGGPGGPGQLPFLLGDAISSGRAVRPPIPFEAGWWPVLTFCFFIVTFAVIWLGTVFGYEKGAVVAPLVILGVTAISQPPDGEALSGVLAAVPVLAALAVTFGGNARSAANLTTQFEIRRLVRGALAIVPLLALILAVNNLDFLFPKTVYDPSKQPIKPRTIPLAETEDRVLFEVIADQFTGPWRVGVLDVYDGEAWKIPPFDLERLEEPDDGKVAEPGDQELTIGFKIRDLGKSPTLVSPANPRQIDIDKGVLFDPRTGIFRMESGVVPGDLDYSVIIPPYPDGGALQQAPEPTGELAEFTEIGAPPATVQAILASAPENPWLRLEFVRKAFLDVVIAAGAGVPIDIDAARVEEIFTVNPEATPYEIVAAQAMLARWAGLPARIGFGFDGVNEEEGVLTVRPKNAAQWLEVHFEGHGWVPLIGAPPRAKTSLNADPNARFDPTIVPSDDVAIDVYIAVKLRDFLLLYEQLRRLLLILSPFLLLAVATYLAWAPWMKHRRRKKRREWAAWMGPRAEICAEYCEFRDTATDLGMGDPYATPLEFLDRFDQDEEHSELAWLTSRALYGDMMLRVNDTDVSAARELVSSLRRRMILGRPTQVRVLGWLSRASLREPFTLELPNIKPLSLPGLGRVRAKIRRPLASSRR